MKYFGYFSRIMLISIFFLTQQSVLLAQDTSSNLIFRITNVNTDHFPHIQVSVSGALPIGANLLTQPIALREDQQDQVISTSSAQDIGVQIGIAIDPNNLKSSGNTATSSGTTLPHYSAIVEAVSDLGFSGLLRAETDWLSTYTIGLNGSPETISTWAPDHGSVANSLMQHYDRSLETFSGQALTSLLTEAFNQFESSSQISEINPRVQRFLVLFSDGTDSGNIDVPSIVRQANALKIHLYPILLGSGNEESLGTFRLLAEQTNGQFTVLQSQEDVRGVWESLSKQRLQWTLTYRTTHTSPTIVTAELTDLEKSASAPVPNISLPAFGIDIIEPAAEQVIHLPASATELPIVINSTWDGIDHQLSKVVYTLSGPINDLKTQENSLGRFNFPVSELLPGRYVLEVEAKNNFGIEAETQKIAFTVDLEEDAAPAAQLDASADVTHTNTISAAAPALLASADSAPANDNPQAPEGAAERGIGLATLRNIAADPLVRAAAAILIPLIALLSIYRLRRHRSVHIPEPNDSYQQYNDHFSNADQDLSEPDEDPFDDDSETELKERIDTQPPALDDVPLVEYDDLTEPIQLPEWAYAWLTYVEGGEGREGELPEKLRVKSFGEQIIGRSEQLSDIVIKAKFISRQHAVITAGKDGYYIKDNGSAGGTFVNRQHLEPEDNIRLEDGDILNFNHATYLFEIAKPADQEAPNQPEEKQATL